MDLADQIECGAGPRRRTPSQTGALASLGLCMLLPSLGTSIANVALPTLAASFEAPLQQVQWVVLAYLLATTTLVVGAGRWGDIVGRRRLLTGGIALFNAASVLCGMATELRYLIAARALQGLGAAVMMALAMAFVGAAVPKAGTGRAIGLLGSLSAVGTALGPTLGGLLIGAFGWPAIFFVGVPVGVVALALVQRHLPADAPAPTADRPRFDTPGTLLLALTLAAYALAMTPGRGRFGPLNAALLAAAAVGAGLFVWAQARSEAPLIPLAMLRDRTLSAGLSMGALVSSVVMATLVVGPFYLSGALGLGSAAVGTVMSVGPAAAALAGVPAGHRVDRFGAPLATLAGLGAMAAGCLALCLLPGATGTAGLAGVAAYVVPIVVLTAGYALFQAANHTALMADVPADRRGVVSGLLNLSRNLGLITGASLMGALFALASRTGPPSMVQPEALATGMRVTFGVATALVLAAAAVAWAWRPGPRAGGRGAATR